MSSRHNSAVLNVFGRREDHSSGNAATVFWLDDDLETAEMIAIAQLANTPACAFIRRGSPLPRVQFVTATAVLPFCGHGALAAGVAEAIRSGHESASFLVEGQEVRVSGANAGLSYLVMRAQGTAALDPHPEPLLAALGLSAGDLDQSVIVASVGSPKWLVSVRNVEVLRALQPGMQALLALSQAAGINGAYVYAANPTGTPADILARGFNPKGGVPEDAATGAAAAALAWYERARLQGRWLVIDQGIGLERLNRIHVRVCNEEIHLGGNVVLTRRSELLRENVPLRGAR
jgi:trans-2,3-dihydro-3-hydroxyanthranilate isomerase